MGLDECTISRVLERSSYSFNLNKIGSVDSNGFNGRFAVRPTFSLNSDVAIDGEHIGSKIDLYCIIK